MAALTMACVAVATVLGAVPGTQAPQLEANALPAKNVGIANADAITTALIIFIDFMLPPES